MRLLTVFVALAVLASVAVVEATRVTVMYYSDPPGATIYQNGQPLGIAPAEVRYEAPGRFGRFRECLTLQPLKFRWISGVEVDIKDLQACPPAGKRQHFTVMRPTGMPGIEIDANYAIALMQQRTAAHAASDAAANAVLPPLPRTKICTSTVIGNQIFTNCI